jgi:hypothetical protein
MQGDSGGKLNVERTQPEQASRTFARDREDCRDELVVGVRGHRGPAPEFASVRVKVSVAHRTEMSSVV